jgi:hypothetical protein
MNCSKALSPKNVQHTDVFGRLLTQFESKTLDNGHVADFDTKKGKKNQ